VCTLTRSETVAPEVSRYLNRLSDLLFVLARVLARHERGSEVLWKRGRGAQPDERVASRARKPRKPRKR
jgi:cob(I)alamin adenosyltransferase